MSIPLAIRWRERSKNFKLKSSIQKENKITRFGLEFSDFQQLFKDKSRARRTRFHLLPRAA